MTWLKFFQETLDGVLVYSIYNEHKQNLGRIQKIRIGQFLSWCLLLNEDCYLSASCLDEVRAKIRELNNNRNDTKKRIKSISKQEKIYIDKFNEEQNRLSE